MGCGASSTSGGTGTANTEQKAPATATDTGNQSKDTKSKPASNDSDTKQKTTDNGNLDNEFTEDGVKCHNDYRSKHSAPAMTASDELTTYAQKYADKIAKLDKMEHSNCTLPSGGRVGENLYCFWSSDTTAMPTADDAVKAWYDEIKDYDFGAGGFSMDTGHFTQVVWKGSTELGMGWAKSAKGTTYVVATYRPAGNMMGDFDNNVTQS